jgi:osmoprotectant transport system substrate-binding protein
MQQRVRGRAVGAALVALALVMGACGDDDGGTREGPTITVGSFNFGESLILSEIYAQVLETNGYPVGRSFNLGSRELVYPALTDGAIDLLPEYTGSLLTFRGGTPLADQDATYAALTAAIGSDDLVALDYAPAQDKNGIVVTGATAASLGLTTVSDLAAHNGTLVFGGPPECPQRDLCLLGLERVYGLEFASFSPLDVGGPITVAALKGGEIDVALLFTTSGVIAAEGFVLLEDDLGLQPAENIVPITTAEIVAAYGADFTDLLDAVSAKITTSDLTAMNKRYDIDTEDAEVIAAEWLAANGF